MVPYPSFRTYPACLRWNTHPNTHLLSSRTGAVESLEVANLLAANSGPHFHRRCFCQDRDLALHPNTQGHDKAFHARKFPLPPSLEKPPRHFWLTHSYMSPSEEWNPTKPLTQAIGENVAKWTMNLFSKDQGEKKGGWKFLMRVGHRKLSSNRHCFSSFQMKPVGNILNISCCFSVVPSSLWGFVSPDSLTRKEQLGNCRFLKLLPLQ